jgi:hypothetical protein
MLKRFDEVLGFSQHQPTSVMMANLAQQFSKAARATGLPVVWRRVPITTVTLLLVLSIWFYDRMALSSGPGSVPPASNAAAIEYPPAALVTPTLVSFPSSPRIETDRVHLNAGRVPAKPAKAHTAKAAQSAFREKVVGQNEVDYVANDVTVRLFAAKPKPAPAKALNGKRQVKFGKDVTVRYFDNPAPMQHREAAATQAGDASSLVSK